MSRDVCPVCEELQELCRHCGYCKEFCTSDESQRDFDSEDQEDLVEVGKEHLASVSG